MKIRYYKVLKFSSFALLFISFLTLSIPVCAQIKGKGEVSGKITDEEDGEGLIGATAVLKGTSVGAVANINGEFQLANVPLGAQTLEFSFVGYSKSEITINVKEGVLVTLQIKLKRSNVLDEVVIVAASEAQYSPIRNSTDIQLISKIKFSEGVLAGISNEQIAKSIDRDASQIVQRIAGVSLVDRFVVVRGLDPRYNMTLVNGLVGPSSEEGSRAFSFDAIPTGIIDRIEVEKSPGPHLPGMWGGGVIKIFTRNFTTTRSFNFDISGAYRTSGSSFNNNFLTYKGSNKDWYANGAADRQLPGIMRSPNFVYPNFVNYPAENIAIARSPGFDSFVPKNSNSDLDKRVNMSYYDSWPIGKLRLNSLTSASYTQESVFRVSKIASGTDLYQLANGTPGVTDSVSNASGTWFYPQGVDEQFVDSLYEKQVRISAVQSLGLLFNDNHNVSLTLFYNRFGTDQLTNAQGTEIETQDQVKKTFTYKYEQRDIIVGQLGGSHRIGANSVEWTGGVSLTSNNVPDLQRQTFFRSVDETGELYTTQFIANFIETYQAHYVFETEEVSLTGRLDLRRDFANGAYAKAGLFFDRKERSFYSYQYGIYTQSPDINPSYKPWLSYDSLTADDQFSTSNLYVVARSDDQGAYFFDDQAAEGYLSFNYPIIKDRLTFYGGARFANYVRVLYNELNVPVEKGTLSIFGKTLTVPDQTSSYILPSGMLKYSFDDGKYIIRAVYGQSVDRPQFREQSDQAIFNFESRVRLYGNPALENSLIQSADLRIERYGKVGEFLSVGFFYKDIDKPIQLILRGSGSFGSNDGNYANIESAKVLGFEVEWRKKFDFTTLPIIRRMSINLNASYIWTEAKLDKSKADLRGEPSGTYSYVRLQGSSPILANAAIYYERLESGTLLSAIYNLTWDRVIDYGASDDIGNRVEGRRHRIDLVFKQRITSFLTLKAGVQDLLNRPQILYRDENANYKFDPGINNIVVNKENPTFFRGDTLQRSFKPGSYFSLGLSLNIQNNKAK